MDAHLIYFLECIMVGLFIRNSCLFSLQANFKNFIFRFKFKPSTFDANLN